MDKKQMLKRKEELISQIKQVHESSFEKLYVLIDDLFKIGKELDKNYTQSQLAREVDMNISYVNHILNLNKATKHCWELVKEKKITLLQLSRLTCRVPVENLDESVDYVLKHKMTNDETERYITQKGFFVQDLEDERTYKKKWNLVRDFNSHLNGLDVVLRTMDGGKIPETQIENVILKLKELKKDVNASLGTILNKKQDKPEFSEKNYGTYLSLFLIKTNEEIAKFIAKGRRLLNIDSRKRTALQKEITLMIKQLGQLSEMLKDDGNQ